jgi:hypothetical protein
VPGGFSFACTISRKTSPPTARAHCPKLTAQRPAIRDAWRSCVAQLPAIRAKCPAIRAHLMQEKASDPRPAIHRQRPSGRDPGAQLVELFVSG